MTRYRICTVFALSHFGASRAAFRAHAFAYAGRWREVLAELGGTLEAPLAGLLDTRIVNGAVALMYVCALLGRVAEAPRAGARGIGIFEVFGDDGGILAMRMIEGVLLVVPFLLDDQASRQGHDADIARVTRRADERGETVPPQLHRCPPLIVAGAWAEAAALWAQRRDVAVTLDLAINLPYIGAMARAQGNRDEAWALVREGVPDGLQTEPGTTHFAAVDLFCLAARLALDEGKCAQAGQWLEAHERWLAWAGPEVRWGRANGHLAWAEYYRAIDESDAALRHTEQALDSANAPRQPLALLAGHCLLGELLREIGRYAEARAHIDAALALADACGAPYERALTLLASAALDATTGNVAVATAALDAVRAICTPLGAQPALDRATTLITNHSRALEEWGGERVILP